VRVASASFLIWRNFVIGKQYNEIRVFSSSWMVLRHRDNFRFYLKGRDNSVGVAPGYGLDYRGSRVRFPVGAGKFSLRYRVQNGSGAHPASYPMDTSGFFPGGKVAGA
jgi:hypothetical protein